MRARAAITAAGAVLAVAAVPPAEAAVGASRIAALQTGLHALGLYRGTIDGVEGPATRKAVRALQRRAGLAVDGVVGPRTRAALGRYGRPDFGARVLGRGHRGWDVAELQFQLAWHGFPSGPFDGVFGPRTDAALRRFQRFAGLRADGRAGPATVAVLRRPPPRAPYGLDWPVDAAVGDHFGPRGERFHAGIDIPASEGRPVRAARTGVVSYAGWAAGGWGNVVIVSHGDGVQTVYAHLSRVDVQVARTLLAGAVLGLVGSTGESSGPHLHFELRVRGAAVDPMTGLAET